MSYEMTGTGEPLLFIHGALVSRAMWRKQIDYFSTLYRVIAPDLPAHGDTPDVEGEYTIVKLSDWIVQLLDAFGIEHIHVCGLSLGGMVAQQLTVSHPHRVKKLVLAETAFGTQNSLWERIQTSMAILFMKVTPQPTLMNVSAHRYGSSNRHVGAFIRQEMGRYDRRTTMRVMNAGLRFPGKQQLRRILSPTLVLIAEQNEQTHGQGKQMTELIPNARLAILPASHHLLNMDNPEAFNQVVLEFLKD